MLTPQGHRTLRTARLLLYGLASVVALLLAVLSLSREVWINAAVLFAVSATAVTAWLRERRSKDRPDS
ncbi:hypothetical protein [Streptomyces sp. NPDC002845]